MFWISFNKVPNTAVRYVQLVDRAGAANVDVCTFAEFLRSFVDVTRLERSCAGSFDAYHPDKYVVPTLLAKGDQLTISDFLDQILLARYGERLIVVHAPGGRGKTALSEFLTSELFTRAKKDARLPLPFLVKFSEHRGVSEIDSLLHETLRSYGLQFELDSAAVDRLLKHGVFVLVLDGFDELAEKASESLMARNVSELAPKIHRDTSGRAVLTCRSTFLTAYSRLTDEILTQSSNPTFLLAELQQFRAPQVDKFLSDNAPPGVSAASHRDRVKEFIRQKKLAELAREPLTLRMLSEVVGDAKFGLPQNLGEVYLRFVDTVCDREIERHELPEELPQKRLLAALALDMVELGAFLLQREWAKTVFEKELGYHAAAGVTDEQRKALVQRLLDHYLITPQALVADADVRFQHPTYRDFLFAWLLGESLSGRDRTGFLDLFGAVELPEETLRFLAELLEPPSAAHLDKIARSLQQRGFRNLVRLLCAWDGGSHFREVLPPPFALAAKQLEGLSFDGIDLRGYVWKETTLDGATFRSCDLHNCDLGTARWREIRLDSWSLAGIDLGDGREEARIIIDGELLAGEKLATTLHSYEARGPGVRALEQVPEAEDPVLAIVREVLKKVVEGNRREQTFLRNVKPETLIRGAACAPHAPFVERRVLPAMQKEPVLYLAMSGDRHGTLTLARSRVREVQDFLFEGKLSPDLKQLVDQLRPAFTRAGPVT